MPPKVKFNDGEHVLCFHGPLLYEAKCIKSEVKEKTVKYLVHYNGWNKNWDEWVPESRILKANEAGFQKQKELKQAHLKSKSKGLKGSKPGKKADKDSEPSTPTPADDKKKTPPTTTEKEKSTDNVPLSELVKKKRSRISDAASDTPSGSGSTSEPPKKKRAKPDTTVESEDSFLTKVEVRVKIPEDLKPWLVDDWDLVTRQKQLVQLPCKQTVESILDDFIKSKQSKANNPQKDTIQEVTQGIREYFNAMLGTQLLYKFERPQYAEILAKYPDQQMCKIYGASHLLRLFVKLGGMLAYTQLDEKSLQLLLTHIHDFLKYMSRSANTLFNVSDYMVAPAEHHRKAL